jgi:diguanylate cyclase (GGDEF)-like protein
VVADVEDTVEKGEALTSDAISADDLRVRRLLEAGKVAEANALFDQVVAKSPATSIHHLTRAVILVYRAVNAWGLGRIPLALELAAEGWTELDVEHGDDPTAAQTIGMLGYLMEAIGHRRTALEMLRLSVNIAEQTDDSGALAHCLQRLGGALNFRALDEPPEVAGRTFAEAATLLERGLTLAPHGRVRRALLGAYARALAGTGQLERSEQIAIASRTAAGEAEDRWGVAVGNWVLAAVRRNQGELVQARTLASRAVADAELIRDYNLLLRFSLDLADVCAELGDQVGEATALRRSVTASQQITDSLQEGLVQALEQRRLAVQARRLAIAAQEAAARDPLTGLANRLGLERAAPQLLESTMSHGRVPWLVLLDVDWFKTVNDDAGHAAGDATLREIAQLLRRECRTDDLIARWAGDEFVVLLTDSGDERPDVGPAVAERIRAAVDRHDWTMVLGEVRRPTVSIGVAAGPAKLDQLFVAADIALYRAKRHGRNRVEVHSPNGPEHNGPEHELSKDPSTTVTGLG